VEVAGGEALVAEGVQQPRVPAEEDARHLLAHSDHLVAVVRVEDAVQVRPQVVEDREIVRREGADPARARVPVQRAAAFEARHRVREPGAEEVGESGIHGRGLRVGVELDVVLDDEG
jgi:hypothetical protein